MQKRAIGDIASEFLNQARLQPLGTSTPNMEQIFKNVPASNPQRIHDLTMKLKSTGLDLEIVTYIGYKLSQLYRETDLDDPMKIAIYFSEPKRLRF